MPSPTRRELIKSAVAATGTMMTAPLFLNASDKAGTKLPRVGSGALVYECHHDWDRAHLPPNHSWGNASHGVAVDSQGQIYITHHGNPGSIFVFDTEGKFVRAFGDLHRTTSGKGHGIDIRKEGSEEFLYLSPNDASLFFAKMSLSGELVWQRGRKELNRDSGGLLDRVKRYRPTNTSFRPDGGYYLGDGYGSNYLFQYDRNDQFVGVLGGGGKSDGKFQTPHGQWLDDRDGTPRLVVADRANKRLQWFNMNGDHHRTLDGFLFPADIDVQGELLLVPDLYTRVTILDGQNEMTHLGDDEVWRKKVLGNKNTRNTPSVWEPGRFVHPHDACFDANGNIFVVEWVKTGRVTKLTKVT